MTGFDDRSPDQPRPADGMEPPGDDPRGAALRQLLLEETADVSPDPAGWDRIQWRAAAARRRARRVRWGTALASAAAVMVAALAATAILGDDNGADERPVVAGPGPDAGDDGGGEPGAIPVAEVGPGIWPFHTGGEADAYAAERAGDPGAPDYEDPAEVATAFFAEYLGGGAADAGEARQGDTRSWEVPLRTRDGGPVTTVLVRQLGESQVLAVVGAVSSDIHLDRPTALEGVRSPVQIRGQSRSFEGNVVVSVRDDTQLTPGEVLGEAPLTGSGGPELGPLEGEVPFDEAATRTGAVVAATWSAADGSLEQATVVRIYFEGVGGAPAGGGGWSSVTAVPAGHVVVSAPAHGIVELDGAGNRVRTLVPPDGRDEATFTDVALTPDRTGVYWTLFRGGDCEWEIWHTGVGEIAPVQVADGHSPAVSPDGTRVAYAADTDCDGQQELEVLDRTDGSLRTWADIDPGDGDEQLPIGLANLTWSADGRQVVYEVQYEDGVGIQAHDTMAGAELRTGAARRLEPDDRSLAWTMPELRPDGRIAVLEGPSPVGTGDGETAIRVLDLASGREIADAGTPLPGVERLDFYDWSPSGDLIYAVDGDRGWFWRVGDDGERVRIDHGLGLLTGADW